MDYRYLGRSALKVSPLTLGSMMFGGPTDEATARRIIAKAYEQGVNFIDTADVYHDGQSETVVGRAIAHQRDHWVLATKFGYSRAAWAPTTSTFCTSTTPPSTLRWGKAYAPLPT